LRLELERLLPPLPFDDVRPFAVVRLRPPLDELPPFDELLPRLDELLLRLDEPPLLLDEPPLLLDELPLRLDDEERLRELAELLLRLDEERPRELDDERSFLTSPSSILPRQDPVSSSSIIT
jgi:hypothetical protein